MNIIISIINMFLVGLMWIMAAAIVILIIAFALLATWMQVNEERNVCHGYEEAPEGNAYHTAGRGSRRTAYRHSCQVP